MTDHPILFSADMIRALLAGTKTQTRRVLKPIARDALFPASSFPIYDTGKKVGISTYPDDVTPAVFNQKINVGDRLWVREAHFAHGHWITTDELTPTGKLKRKFVRDKPKPVSFKSGGIKTWPNSAELQNGQYKRLGRFMFRADSRITLNVTDVRIERLQDVSEADAIAEGIELVGDGWRDYSKGDGHFLYSPIESYRTLWNSINGPDAWVANPWVVATSFEVKRENIDGRVA